jgi:hypothetical protein
MPDEQLDSVEAGLAHREREIQTALVSLVLGQLELGCRALRGTEADLANTSKESLQAVVSSVQSLLEIARRVEGQIRNPGESERIHGRLKDLEAALDTWKG